MECFSHSVFRPAPGRAWQCTPQIKKPPEGGRGEKFIWRCPWQGRRRYFLQSGKVFFLVDAAKQGLPHNVAVPVKNVSGGEGHDVQCKLAGLTAGGKVDVAVACARCLQQFFGGINALLVAVQRLGVDADDLTALCLDLLVQGVQVVQLLHAGLAAVEPEIHHRKGVARKQAVVHRVAL